MHPGSFAPNWFVAIPVPPNGWFDRGITTPPEGFRRFHRDDLHITIAFLGDIGPERARAAWDALRWPLGPVRASLGAIVPMGAPKRYSALSIELDASRDEVERAIGACRDAVCDAAGARREGRPAKAHVTVARPHRRAGEAERAAGLRWAQRIDLRGCIVTLDSVALYTWADDRRERQFKSVQLTSL